MKGFIEVSINGENMTVNINQIVWVYKNRICMIGESVGSETDQSYEQIKELIKQAQ